MATAVAAPASRAGPAGTEDLGERLAAVPASDATTRPRLGTALAGVEVAALRGMGVQNPAGDRLGEVDRIVADLHDGSACALISLNGPSGLVTRRVVVPLDTLRLRDGHLASPLQSPQALLAQGRAYTPADFYPYADGAEVSGSLAGPHTRRVIAPERDPALPRGASRQPGAGRGFAVLDTDGDGAIDRYEARASDRLTREWAEVDRDADGRVDRVEFAALVRRPAVDVAPFAR